MEKITSVFIIAVFIIIVSFYFFVMYNELTFEQRTEKNYKWSYPEWELEARRLSQKER